MVSSISQNGQKMRYSILHLSDLHRDLTDEIPNEWLIDSIERDLAVTSSLRPQNG